MKGMTILSIGENKGAPRVWIQGSIPRKAGFFPGTRFRLEVMRDRDCITMYVDENGSRKVSAKKTKETEVPVIDLNSFEALGLFEGLDQIRVIADTNKIHILPLASESRLRSRLARLRSKLEAGEPLSVGSLSHGGGILSLAIHQGLTSSGVQSKLAFANDIREELLEQADSVNPAWNQDTIALSMPMQELAYDQWGMSRLGEIDILEAGLPCEASSRAGRAKNKNVCVESHEKVGHLVSAFLAIIAKTNPSVVILENVVPYQQTASSWIIRHQLRDMGYCVHETVFKGENWGTLEHRERMCFVAVTRGMEFEFDHVVPIDHPISNLGAVLDDVSADSESYRAVAYLKEKESRDKADGKGFSVPYLTPDATSVPTLRKGYHKGGSCDARLLHPTDPSRSRLLTANEHARCKGIPEVVVSGLSQTIAHELLGQSVLFPPFKALGAYIGDMLKSFTTPNIVQPA